MTASEKRYGIVSAEERRTLGGLELVLLDMGFGLEPGAGVAAFQRSLAEAVAVSAGVA